MARDNGLFRLFGKCACVNAIFLQQFEPACTTSNKTRLQTALNIEMGVSGLARAQLSNLYRTKTHLIIPNGGNNLNTDLYIYIEIAFLSLPAWRQVPETWLQKRPPGWNLGEHRLVQRSGTASRGTVLLLFSLRMRNFARTEFRTICAGKNIHVGSTNHKTVAWTRCSFLESTETFRVHFLHNSLCIFKTKAFRDAKLYSYFLSLYNTEKSSSSESAGWSRARKVFGTFEKWAPDFTTWR